MKELKAERSMPVQSRVDLIELAELDKYWMDQGFNIKSMSQLVSHSISLLIEVLKSNGVDGIGGFETLADANRYLQVRGLRQKSMDKIGMK